MDIISMQDFSKEDILAVLDTAEEIKKAIHDPEFNHNYFKSKYGRVVEKLLEGIKVATLFLENSTRTNHSFRAAVIKAGGNFDGFPSDEYTSLKKGETWADTAAMFSGYGYDALVIRSITEGLPRWTKEYLIQSHQQIKRQHHSLGLPFNYRIPIIINGGDGKNQHPTQCFLDLFTIREIARSHHKDLDGLHLALLNDLAHGRTNASLMSVAHLFNFKLHFAYPPRFGPQKHRLDSLIRNGVELFDHKEDFLAAMKESFIAYHSRPQKERVGKGEDFIAIKRIGQINKEMYNFLGQYAPYLMHPLPIDTETFEEISLDMRDHPKNITKLQSANGIYVRIALLAINLGRMGNSPLLNKKEPDYLKVNVEQAPLPDKGKILQNPRSGYIEKEGIVLDHLPAGMGRRLAGILGFEKGHLPKVISDFLPSKSGFKDIIKIHQAYQLSEQQLEVMALVAPHAVVSSVEEGKVIRKIKPSCGNIIEGRINCGNEACITHLKKEGVIPKHKIENVNGKIVLECCFCEQNDSVENINSENRFRYINS